MPPDESSLTTQWTAILLAASDSPQRRKALQEVCRRYRIVVLRYVQRLGGGAQAEDLAQGFFWRVLEGDFLDQVDPAKGRFRAYLKGAVSHYMSEQRKHAGAARRGGHAEVIEYDAAEARNYPQLADDLTPDEVFDRHWAQVVLDRALRELAREFDRRGEARRFEVLAPFCKRNPGEGEYRAVAEMLGMDRDQSNAVAAAVKRMRARLQQLVRIEVARTVERVEDIDPELGVLGGG